MRVVVVASGFAASSGTTVRPGLVAVGVASMAAAGIVLQASLVEPTTATSADYFTLGRPDGSGGAFLAHSGGGNAWSAPIVPPTPWLRVATANGAALTSPRSFALVNVVT